MVTKNLFFILLAFLLSCGGKGQNEKKEKNEAENVENKAAKSPMEFASGMNYKLHYDLSKPDHIYKLPKELKEISGISTIDNDHLACVQDESGILYIYNLPADAVDSKIPFGSNGDYEAVAVVKKDVYILESNGRLSMIKNFAGKAPATGKFPTGLTSAQNCESMCYDPSGNQLLILPKDQSGDKNKKGIYRFNLSTKKMEDGTVFQISTNEIKKFVEHKDFPELSKKLKEGLSKNDVNELFRPTDIAVNPVSGEIYIISSVDNLLFVLEKSGKLGFIYALEGSNFMQPEGITFTSGGDMYISNEGQNGKPNIVKFNYEN